jgi:hypothetical protein
MAPQAGCSRTRRRVSGESAQGTGAPSPHRAQAHRPPRPARESRERFPARHPVPGGATNDGVSRRFSSDLRAIFNYNLITL